MDLHGKLVCLKDYEAYASRTLPSAAWYYYSAGAGEEYSLRENRTAFSRLFLRQRNLIDLSGLTMQTKLLGEPVSMPVAVSPTGAQRLAHPDGELATVRAAEAAGTVVVVSQYSTSRAEDVRKAAPNCNIWQQINLIDKSRAIKLVRKAEELKFKAIVVSVDGKVGVRYVDKRMPLKLPPHIRFWNYVDSTDDREMSTESGGDVLLKLDPPSADAGTWADIDWLVRSTQLPLVLKGILNPNDAVRAVEHGAAAIVVSNHGARKFDSFPATIDCLGEVVDAVREANAERERNRSGSGAARRNPQACEVYVDGGFRTGSDVMKGLAMGADAVFLGRPILWGLAHSGAEGVENVLNIVRDELKLAFSVCGCTSMEDISRDLFVKPNPTAHFAKL